MGVGKATGVLLHPLGAAAPQKAAKGPVSSSQGRASQPREVAARWHCGNAGVGISVDRARPGTWQHRAGVKNSSGALPAPHRAQVGTQCPPVKPSKAPPLPPVEKTGHESS